MQFSWNGRGSTCSVIQKWSFIFNNEFNILNETTSQYKHHLLTLLWHSLNVAPVMMLHIIFAQWCRLFDTSQVSRFSSMSGQVLDTFQLFANSNALLTTSWPWVVKSFCPSPSKFPHKPHTLPCSNTGVTKSLAELDKWKMKKCLNGSLWMLLYIGATVVTYHCV